jgi:MFS family permease
MKKFLLPIPDKGVFFLAISQFGNTFSMNFIAVFMPFYILKISDYSPRETMLWTGLIMGGPSLVAAFMSPVWGRLTSRFRPKLLFERALLANGIITLLYGFAGKVYILFLLRCILGLLGGASTVGLILITVLSPKERIHKDISLYQVAMTTGQLIGPPVGAYMVSLTGYRASFVMASFIISVFFVFCYHYVKDIPPQKTASSSGKSSRKGIFWGWALSLLAIVHITYIPSILPHILENFHLKEGTALNFAGMIMMAYTLTAILGNYLINNFAPRHRLRSVILYTGLSAAFFQAAMCFGNGVFSFTLIRMLQTGAIAAIFPMILSVFASGARGQTLGLLNSARFAGNAIGPLMATSILAYSNLSILYLIIAGLTLVALTAFLRATRTVPSGTQEGKFL